MNLSYSDLMEALEGAKHGSEFQRKLILELAGLIEEGFIYSRKEAMAALRSGKAVYNRGYRSSIYFMVGSDIYYCSYGVEIVTELSTYGSHPDAWSVIELFEVTKSNLGTRSIEALNERLADAGQPWPFPLITRPNPPPVEVIPPPEAMPIIEAMNRPEPVPVIEPEPAMPDMPCAEPTRGDMLELL